jgi:hypothetical protein
MISGSGEATAPLQGVWDWWFALVVHEHLGSPRVTCRLRDVATRQDLLPALETAFRCHAVAGRGFCLLMPEGEEDLQAARAAPWAPGGGRFGPWLAQGSRVDLAFAAVSTLTYGEVKALLGSATVDVPFLRLSPMGQAAFIACEREIREMQKKGALTGPVPDVDWGHPDKFLVRLRVVPEVGFQAGCVTVTTDGGTWAF